MGFNFSERKRARDWRMDRQTDRRRGEQLLTGYLRLSQRQLS